MVASKYTTGQYALCPVCGARPCLCQQLELPDLAPSWGATAGALALVAPGPADEVDDELAERKRPKSGNAMRFSISDRWIPHFKLTPSQQVVLWRLERVTTGRGRHAGDFVSRAELASNVNLSVRAVQRALDGLEAKKLLLLTRQYDPATKEWRTTHVRLVLPESGG
jgi:hypothetical protein